MGIAGDMLMAALWQLIPNKEKVIEDINSIGLPHTQISFEEKTSCGINGTYANVLCHGVSENEGQEHHHSNLGDICEIINSLNIPNEVKDKAIKTYNIIAQAESKVHGTKMQNIHFHEVGTLDAIADVVVCSYLLYLLAPDKIICSPVNVGSGCVKCTHGILPVPAPATAEILKGVPFYTSNIRSELCTPTGAALVKANVTEFSEMPKMICSDTGYGFGKKEFDTANCIRVFIGDAYYEVIELACNIDDMTAEDLAYACDILIKSGALDVSQTPIAMKKSRLGTMLSVICKAEDRKKILSLIFKHTSTIGIREYKLNRHTLDRKINKINTPLGDVLIKKSSGFNTKKEKTEHDDLEKIANDNNLSIDEVKRLINNNPS